MTHNGIPLRALIRFLTSAKICLKEPIWSFRLHYQVKFIERVVWAAPGSRSTCMHREGTMPKISVNITTPCLNEPVPNSIVVTGTTNQLLDTPGLIANSSVSVQFGEGGPIIAAQPVGEDLSSWNCHGVVPGVKGTQVKLTATARGRFIPIGSYPATARNVTASSAVLVTLA